VRATGPGVLPRQHTVAVMNERRGRKAPELRLLREHTGSHSTESGFEQEILFAMVSCLPGKNTIAVGRRTGRRLVAEGGDPHGRIRAVLHAVAESTGEVRC
jgi:hypothetical protein